MNIVHYPPVIRVRRPKRHQVEAQVSATSGPVPRRPFGSDVRWQVLGEFTAAARRLAR
jgi:hypothetical protein